MGDTLDTGALYFGAPCALVELMESDVGMSNKANSHLARSTSPMNRLSRSLRLRGTKDRRPMTVRRFRAVALSAAVSTSSAET